MDWGGVGQLSSRIERLERLYELKTMGAISDEEYLQQKTKLIESDSDALEAYEEIDHSDSSGNANPASKIRRHLSDLSESSNKVIDRLFFVMINDQSKGCSPFNFNLLANRRLAQSARWRLWSGVIGFLILLGSIVGNFSFGERLLSLSTGFLFLYAGYLLTRWRNLWAEVLEAVIMNMKSDPESSRAFKESEEKHLRVLEINAAQYESNARFAREQRSESDRVDELERVRRNERMKESDLKDRERKMKNLNMRAQQLTRELNGGASASYKKRCETELRGIEIEILSLK